MFCFKPSFDGDPSSTGIRLADLLVRNKVKEVIFTGGEPLLSTSLEPTLEVLNKSGIDASVHTNAMLLNPSRLENLANLVDEIAVPIDSLDAETQGYLRGGNHLPQVKKVFEQLQDKDVRIGVHTVATALNINHIPEVYDFLSKGRFDYWRIYEFNFYLVSDMFASVKRFLETKKLRGKPATEYDGGVNCFFAEFLLMEEKLSKYNDSRVQFVGVRDYDRNPYFFLNSGGDVHLCTYFLQGRRKYVGNVLREGFKQVKDRAVRQYSQGPLLDEDAFVETENDNPLWARVAWQGNYYSEELKDIKPRYYIKFNHLSGLYLARIKKQGQAPKSAELDAYLVRD